MVTLGLYQLAYQIFMALSVLPVILFSYILPEKSAGAKTKEVEILGILISIALAASVVVLSPTIIPWVFPNFAESVGLVQVMSLGAIPFTVAATKMSELYARERPGAVLVSYAAALVVGIAGILVLGSYFGTIGLATGMLLLQTTLAASLFLAMVK
jgi:O-antigen/teichoic acid export membrane protein